MRKWVFNALKNTKYVSPLPEVQRECDTQPSVVPVVCVSYFKTFFYVDWSHRRKEVKLIERPLLNNRNRMGDNTEPCEIQPCRGIKH